jgi:hypothetical protein
MSISGISSNSNAYPTPAESNRNAFRTDFSQLARALNAGDLSGPQWAFSALQQLQPGRFAASSSSGGSQAVSGTSPIGADIATLGKALKSGDLGAAQDAFKKVQQDMSSVHRGHHHHHHANAAQSVPTATDASATDDPLAGGQLGLTA